MEGDALATARTNYAMAIAKSQGLCLPDPGGRWGNYCSQARIQFDRFTTPAEVIHHVQTANTGFETRSTGEALEQHCRALEDACEKLFPEFSATISSFVETQFSTPETVMGLRGRRVSTPLLWHMRIIMAIVQHCRPEVVLEIGGGYGAPGRVWMTNDLHRPRTYINVDFPETLFYADVYLRTTSPEAEVIYAHDVKAPRLPDGPAIILCPIHNIDAVLSAPDLVVNTGSLQEMSDAYVAFYMDKIDRSAAGRFYSFNRFAQSLDEPAEVMNLAAPTMSPQWSTVFRRFHPGERSRAEILFVRSGEDVGSIEAADAAVTGPDPTDGAAFLDIFDVVRRAGRPGPMLEAAAKAMLGMSYVPREAVWLARAAEPTTAAGRFIRSTLERLATASDIHGIQDRAIRGRIEADVLLVDNERFPLSDAFGGSIESAMELEEAAEIGGWAADVRNNAPAQAIIAAVDDIVVARTHPVGRRPDIEAGYGAGIRPARYTIKVPLNGKRGEMPVVRLFTITAENTAAELRATRKAVGRVRFL